MTFQWILAGINLILVMFEMSLALRFKRKERELRERESALKDRRETVPTTADEPKSKSHAEN